MGKKKPVYTAYLQVVKNRVTTFGENAETKEALNILKMYGIRTDTMKIKGELKESDTAIMVRIALNLDDPTEDWTINGSPIQEIAYGNVLRYWPLSIVDMNKTSGQKIRIQYPEFDIDCEVVYTINATDEQVLGEPETTNESTQKEDNIMGLENQEQETQETQVQGAVETPAVETEAKAKKKLPKWAFFTIVGAAIATGVGVVTGLLLSKKAKSEADEAPVEA